MTTPIPSVLPDPPPKGDPIELDGVTLELSTDPEGARHASLTPTSDVAWDERWAADDLPNGVARVVAHEASTGARTYRLGAAQLLAELDQQSLDAAAALDLLLALGRVVDAASHLPGAPAHGRLGPWQVVLHHHGAVSVLGYGLAEGADLRDDIAAIGACVSGLEIDASESLQELLARCVAPDPARRPQSGAELVAQVRALRQPTGRSPKRGWLGQLGAAIAREWAAPYDRLVVAPRRRRERRAVAATAAVAMEALESCRLHVEEALAQAVVPFEGPVSPEAEAARQASEDRLEGLTGAVGEAREAAETIVRCRTRAEADAQGQVARERVAAIEDEVRAALDQLQAAALLAEDPSWMVERARGACAKAAEVVGQLVQRAQASAEAVRDRADDAGPDEAVEAELKSLVELVQEFERAHESAVSAAEGASALDSVARAEAAIEAAHESVEEEQQRGARLDALLGSLSGQLDLLESTSQALDDARQTLGQAIEAVQSDLEQAEAAAERLGAAIAEHAADGTAVDEARTELQTAVAEVGQELEELRALSTGLTAVTEQGEARKVARAAQIHRENSEEASEDVASAEAAGHAAVERCVQDRQEEARRTVTRAREEVQRLRDEVDQTVTRVQAVVEAASEEATALQEKAPQEELWAALEIDDWSTEPLETLDAFEVELTDSEDTTGAQSAVDSARELMTTVQLRASEVREAVLVALDGARARADVAEASERARQELTSLAERVTAADQEVQEALEALEEPLAVVPGGAARLGEARAKGRAAAEAAGALTAVVEQLGDDDPLEQLQAWLAEGRSQAATVLESARGLQSSLATARVDQEHALAEAAAKALEDARRAVEDQASQAEASAAKAQAWLDAGQREVRDAGVAAHPPAGLEVLRDEVAEVVERAAQTATLVPAARAAGTLEEVTSAGGAVEEAARRAVEAASGARRALHRLRATLTERDAVRDAVADIAAEVRGHDLAASQLSERADVVLSGLEVWTRPVDPGTMDGAVGAAHAACVDVQQLAAEVVKSVARLRSVHTVAEARDAADEAGRAMQAAITAAGHMVAQEREAREVLREVMGRSRPPRAAHLPRNVSRGGLRVGHALRARLRDD